MHPKRLYVPSPAARRVLAALAAHPRAYVLLGMAGVGKWTITDGHWRADWNPPRNIVGVLQRQACLRNDGQGHWHLTDRGRRALSQSEGEGTEHE